MGDSASKTTDRWIQLLDPAHQLIASVYIDTCIFVT